jgi:hypothetical protein
MAWTVTPANGTTADFSATSIVINKPSDAVTGAVCLIGIVTDTDHTATISGFVEEAHSTAGTAGTALFSRVLDGSEGSTFNIDFGGSTEAGRAACIVITGNGSGDPFGTAVNTTSADSDGNGSDTDAIEVAVTPDVADSLIVALFGTDPTGSPTSTPIAGTTEIFDLARADNAHLVMSYAVQAGGPASATLRANSSVTNTYASIGLAIAPPAGIRFVLNRF